MAFNAPTPTPLSAHKRRETNVGVGGLEPRRAARRSDGTLGPSCQQNNQRPQRASSVYATCTMKSINERGWELTPPLTSSGLG